MQIKTKTLIIAVGVTIGICFFLVDMLTFYLGFLNGGSITIVLNQYGEMNIEAFFYFPICFIILAISFYLAWSTKLDK